MKRALHMLLLSSLAACNPATRSAASGDKEDINPADRKILGVPAPYPADSSLRARQDELDGSMAARRAVAWATVRKVLQPVPLAEPTIRSGGVVPTVPRFQTWYAKDDFVRMWKELYKELGSDGRKARAPLRDAGDRRHLRLERAHGRRAADVAGRSLRAVRRAPDDRRSVDGRGRRPSRLAIRRR